jgi:hypothetical protein
MKAYGGSGCMDPYFIDVALAVDEWLGSSPGRFTQAEKVWWTPEPVWTPWRRENS